MGSQGRARVRTCERVCERVQVIANRGEGILTDD